MPTFVKSKSITDQKGEKTVIELDTPAQCLAWSDEYLVCGHAQGITLFSNINQLQSPSKLSFHIGLSVELVAISGNIIASVLEDLSITIINILDSSQTNISSSHGHWDFVNSIDVHSSGLVASVGDDRQLILIFKGVSEKIPLEGVGKLVKFQTHGDHLVVLEGYNRLRVFDRYKRCWLYTIYTNDLNIGFKSNFLKTDATIKALFISSNADSNDDILIVGKRWWKKYSSASLHVESGKTIPISEGQLLYSIEFNSYLICVPNSTCVIIVTPKTTFFHSNLSRKGCDIPHEFHTELITAAASKDGNSVVVASDKHLIILKRTRELLQANHLHIGNDNFAFMDST